MYNTDTRNVGLATFRAKMRQPPVSRVLQDHEQMYFQETKFVLRAHCYVISNLKMEE